MIYIRKMGGLKNQWKRWGVHVDTFLFTCMMHVQKMYLHVHKIDEMWTTPKAKTLKSLSQKIFSKTSKPAGYQKIFIILYSVQINT